MTQVMDQPRNNQLSLVDKIEGRIDRNVVTSIGVSANRGMAVESMSQALEVAKLMSVSGSAVPRHLRGNPGACLALAVQGWEWGINPFAIANKSYEVNDRLAYESALYHAVLSRRAPIKGRVKMEYDGEGPNRTCRVWAELADGSGAVEYTSPKFGTIQPKNSPLWKNDPDQQLFYFSVRSFARRHFPDVMMGIATVDEMQDHAAISVVEPGTSRTDALLAKITNRDVDTNQTFEPAPEALADIAAQDAAAAPPPAAETAEPDVSGADTEAPHDVQPPLPDVSTWEQTRGALAEAAQDAGLADSELWSRVALWVLAHPKKIKGQEDKKTTPAERLALVEAVRNGFLGADGKIVAADSGR